eukprot:CAMPEP_0119359436 /NCGR_PEP_ID=MMETSP1334-20130426/7322_1 /TAXON_ID=127549 /ORGANISM="Calcidiscus leptoporus, Strain RCC1130" /LENGTH=177 /DNA_ID=CAMNT_0007374107 /DNA_START=404 /DNA_END=938 /DNA_ORIENTATION=-
MNPAEDMLYETIQHVLQVLHTLPTVAHHCAPLTAQSLSLPCRATARTVVEEHAATAVLRPTWDAWVAQAAAEDEHIPRRAAIIRPLVRRQMLRSIQLRALELLPRGLATENERHLENEQRHCSKPGKQTQQDAQDCCRQRDRGRDPAHASLHTAHSHRAHRRDREGAGGNEKDRLRE